MVVSILGTLCPQLTADEPHAATEEAAAIREILEVRRALGGSVLKGTVLDSHNAAQQESMNADGKTLRPVHVAEAQFIEALQTAATSPPAESAHRDLSSQPAPGAESLGLVAQLRHTAWLLMGKAHRHELANEYKQADRLRREARRLRFIAREYADEAR